MGDVGLDVRPTSIFLLSEICIIFLHAMCNGGTYTFTIHLFEVVCENGCKCGVRTTFEYLKTRYGKIKMLTFVSMSVFSVILGLHQKSILVFDPHT